MGYFFVGPVGLGYPSHFVHTHCVSLCPLEALQLCCSHLCMLGLQVLEITVKRTPRNHYRVQQLCAKLALVDLAGSERAAGVKGARDVKNMFMNMGCHLDVVALLGRRDYGRRGERQWVMA